MTARLPSRYRHQAVDLTPLCDACEYRFHQGQLHQVWVAGQSYDLCYRCGPKLAETSGGAA